MIEQSKSFLEKRKQFIAAAIIIVFMVLIVLLGLQNAKLKEDRNEDRNEDGMDIYEDLIESEIDSLADENILKENEWIPEAPSVEIAVDVKGAVFEPGVYVMEPRSRIIDVIEKAGGLKDIANKDAVNLSQLVEDQMVIYVPEIGEEGFEINTIISSSAQGAVSTENSKEININTADKEALMTLNGIGNVKAENILSYREENGKFQTIEEIKNVSGIGEATFNQLKDVIVVSP